MKKPRITGHQLCMMYGLKNFENGVHQIGNWYTNAKSWVNQKGKRVWSFQVSNQGHPFARKMQGDPWDTRTGESLLSKGLIEPAFTMKHDGSYVNWPDAEVTVYRLTELGKSYL